MPKTYNSLTVGNAAAGSAILASDHAKAFENINNYRVPPMCRLTRTTAQTIASGGAAKTVEFGTATFDTDGMATTGASAKITIKTAGIYSVSFFANWDNPSAAILRQVWVERSSARMPFSQSGSANGTLTLSGSMLMNCAVNDEFQLKAYHERGTNLDVTTFAGNEAAMLSVVWLGQAS